jgi:hypothetical protein
MCSNCRIEIYEIIQSMGKIEPEAFGHFQENLKEFCGSQKRLVIQELKV